MSKLYNTRNSCLARARFAGQTANLPHADKTCLDQISHQQPTILQSCCATAGVLARVQEQGRTHVGTHVQEQGRTHVGTQTGTSQIALPASSAVVAQSLPPACSRTKLMAERGSATHCRRCKSRNSPLGVTRRDASAGTVSGPIIPLSHMSSSTSLLQNVRAPSTPNAVPAATSRKWYAAPTSY